MQPIGSTLRALREQAGFTQVEVAARLSVCYKPTKPRAVSDWERGYGMPSAEQLVHLCDLYSVDNVRLAFLGKKTGLNEFGVRKLQEYATLLEESSRFSYAAEPAALRVLRLFDLPVSAGTGEYTDSDHYELIEVDTTVPLSADYGVRVSGDSMLPRFTDQQVVWVHEQNFVEDGAIGIFYVDGNTYLKKYKQIPDGVCLLSFNPAYEPIPIKDTDSFRVFGKVVG